MTGGARHAPVIEPVPQSLTVQNQPIQAAITSGIGNARPHTTQ